MAVVFPALVLFTLFFRRAPTKDRLSQWVVLGTFAFALPGLVAVVFLRGDGVLRLPATARSVARALGATEAFVRGDPARCRFVRGPTAEWAVPLLIYAGRGAYASCDKDGQCVLPSESPCDGIRGTVAFHDNGLRRGCRSSDEALVCGTASRQAP
jgi:hypothetical protein